MIWEDMCEISIDIDKEYLKEYLDTKKESENLDWFETGDDNEDEYEYN